MQEFFVPLTDEELDHLDALLLERVPEEGGAEDADEGILDISMLDGFMTAVVSGPNPISVSRWLPVVWGDYEPVWENEAQIQNTITLLLRHLNGIADALMNAPDTFEPLFMERTVRGRTFRIVDEWCAGFLLGISLDTPGWRRTPDFDALVEPMMLFATPDGWEKLRGLPEGEVEAQQDRIAPAIRKLHAYWLAQRTPAQLGKFSMETVGRNVLCPCGSGKMFKKCCGAGKTLH